MKTMCCFWATCKVRRGLGKNGNGDRTPRFCQASEGGIVGEVAREMELLVRKLIWRPTLPLPRMGHYIKNSPLALGGGRGGGSQLGQQRREGNTSYIDIFTKNDSCFKLKYA